MAQTLPTTTPTLDVAALQAALRTAGIDGWLFYDFRRSNPIAHRVLHVPESQFFSRRWFYYVPAQGEPVGLVSAVEAHVLGSLPGAHHVYRTWQEYRTLLGEVLAGARRVAMEYVPQNAIPYMSRVDAGTIEMVRELGVEVVSSADLAQHFEAVLTPAQLDSHRAAGRALQQARDSFYAWLRAQLRAGTALTEYDAQQEFGAQMRTAGLLVHADELPLVAVNGNAGNPHYSPTAAHHAPLRSGDLLLLDVSAPLPTPGAIWADYTWMVWLGEQVPTHIASLFATIRDARDAGIGLLDARFSAGERVEGWEVDDAVRAVVTAAGYGEAFVHRTGHNIGTVIHGNGAHLDNLETHDSRVLLANTCVSIEPGIYLPQQGLGLRTEVDVLLLPGSIEVTGTPAQREVLALLA